MTGIGETVGISVDICDPRVDPEPADYAAFRKAAELFVPWDYRLTGIESWSSRNPLVLALVRVDGVLCAAFSAMICRSGRERPVPGPVGGAVRFTPRWVEVAQPWLSGVPGWGYAEELGPDAQRDIVRAFERAICRFVGPGCLGLIYQSVRPDRLAQLSGFGRYVRPGIPDSAMDNTFGSAQDWLDGLGRKRRSQLRGQFRRVDEDEDLVAVAAPARTDVDGAELAALLYRHRERRGRFHFDGRSPASGTYLTALVAHSEVHTLTYRDQAGRLLAFFTGLLGARTLIGQHWAIRDRDDGGKPDLYFAMYRHAVQLMIEGGYATLSMGRGLPELKERLGFGPRPISLVAVPRPVAG